MIGSVSGYTTPKEMKGSVTLMTQRQKALLSCAVAAALLLGLFPGGLMEWLGELAGGMF